MVHHRLLSLALSLQLLLLVCLALPSISSFPTTDEFVPASFAFVQTSNTTTERDVSKIVESIKTFEGAGFPVERCLPALLAIIFC